MFGSINRANLESVVIPTVHSGLEGELEAQLAAVEEKIAAVLDENDELVRSRDELLSLLMSGRIVVKVAEQIAGGVT